MEQPELLIDDDDRYARLRLIAWWDQDKLRASRVLVIGAGALGNEVLKNLALVGVGALDIVDFDTIEPANLTRSVLFRQADRGRPKADIAAAAVRDLNPDIRVRSYHADVRTDIGLGLFRDADVVVGCLDNREARLWVNRACWKTTTPWIDGGIQEINGVVKVFVPPASACYECAMTDADYRLINRRYSCPLLSREDLMAGKVPTAPTIASMIGGLQSQETLKILHGLPVKAGHAMIYNGLANSFYQTAFQRRDDCMSHETFGDVIAVNLQAEWHTPNDVFNTMQQHGGVDGATFRLELDRDLVLSVECDRCGTSREILQVIQRANSAQATCAQCGAIARPELTHWIEPDSPLAATTLRQLGVPPYDMIRIHGDDQMLIVLLAGDREHVS